ncbi:sensor histidine kinase [Streptomyces sp. N50]|uniref:sensor histidine kinase n=1 Tax=Streptomyces sp. N50 TaxID=3081765 RepID=UPI002962070D|nr:sensor histidine kinase [Streptomyces sp. N50]WOX13344.1 sensor histidine kinase [Streptomyces sp. N50]
MSIRGFADRWPFRRKLNLLVGVPLAVVAVLLAYLISDEIGQSTDASDAAQLVRDSGQVAELVNLVEAEHQQAILLSVRFEATNDGGTPSQSAYRKAQLAVDKQVEKVRDTFGDRLPASEAQALKEINGLETLRDTVEQSYLPADNIDPAYTSASDGLIDGLDLEHNANLATTFTGNLLDSVLRADAAHSSFETSVFSATTGDSNALIEYNNAVGSYDLFTYQSARFARFATEDQADQLSGIEHTPAQREIAEAYAELQIDPSGLQAETPGAVRKAFADAMSDYPSYPQQAASRLKITGSLIDQIATRADDASSSASWRAGLLLSLSLLGFVLWLAFVVIVRRSVVRPVQALTGAAKQVAEVAGRELARVADDDAEDDGPPLLRDMPVTAKDEIGDLAEAFNHVQTTAAALLARQVVSRRNVAEMFGNVGRRVSNLTTRQLALIDAVERGETDPALLERLYSIDHIAVRLRRNADSLMLLAGIRETVLDGGPTELTNVVRAALGQIEGFQRVGLRADTEVMVEPDIIGDLTLMVAELLENAVSFSPAGSPVEVVVRTDGDDALIVVADHGLGMSADRIAEENARLIRRERLDLVPTKVLGLFVVGTLARRWDIDVTLARTPGGGVTAEITIPATLLLRMSALASGGSAGGFAGLESGSGSGSGSALASAGSVPDQRPAPSWATADSGAARTTDSGLAATASGYGSSGRSADSVRPAPAVGAPAGRDSGYADSGPRPSVAAEPVREHTWADDEPAPLPRRVSRYETAPAAAVAESAAVTTHHAPADDSATAPDDATGGSRPLRRRVRGATLRTGADAAAQQAARQAPRPADADAVRSALEEFEAAVEQAHRDSDTLTGLRAPDANHPHDQNHLPKGAEQ